MFISGSVSFSVDEVVLTCRSLQRIAEQVQDTEETGRCFHDGVIPRLLSLALQAALQGDEDLSRPSPSAVLTFEKCLSGQTQTLCAHCRFCFSGEASPGARSALMEEAVLSAMVPVISTSCSRLQPTLALISFISSPDLFFFIC